MVIVACWNSAVTEVENKEGKDFVFGTTDNVWHSQPCCNTIFLHPSVGPFSILDNSDGIHCCQNSGKTKSVSWRSAGTEEGKRWRLSSLQTLSTVLQKTKHMWHLYCAANHQNSLFLFFTFNTAAAEKQNRTKKPQMFPWFSPWKVS